MSYKRQKFEFWLNVWREEEQDLAAEIERLKSIRRFADAIRTGLKMVLELDNGKVTTLLKVFPFVLELIQTQELNDAIADAMIEVEKERQVLLQERKLLQQQLDLIEKLQPHMTLGKASRPLSTGTLRLSTGIPEEDEDEEDIQLEITKSDSSKQQSANNFLSSIMSMNPSK